MTSFPELFYLYIHLQFKRLSPERIFWFVYVTIRKESILWEKQLFSCGTRAGKPEWDRVANQNIEYMIRFVFYWWRETVGCALFYYFFSKVFVIPLFHHQKGIIPIFPCSFAIIPHQAASPRSSCRWNTCICLYLISITSYVWAKFFRSLAFF